MFLESSLALPFKNTTYGIYAAGNAVSLVGTWMQRISVSWLTWEMTHSGLWLGIMAFADFFPGLVVGPLAGAFADRTDQLTIVKFSQVVSLLQAMVLFALIAAHHLNIWGLVALTAFQGAVVAFNQPARLALVPSLVAESDLGSALAINSVIFNVARFIGPMVAGLVIVWSGVAASFAANAASYVVFLLALWWVRIDDTAAKASKRRKFSTDFKEGIRYTATHPVIGSLLLLLTAIGIGGRPLNQLLPGFAAQIFHLGAGAFSILASAAGAGAISGGSMAGPPLPVCAAPGRRHSNNNRRRHGCNWIQCDKRSLVRGAVRNNFRLLSVKRGHRYPDDHTAVVRTQHAWPGDGSVRPDISWRAGNRSAGSRFGIGALRVPLADYYRRSGCHCRRSMDFQQTCEDFSSAAEFESGTVADQRAEVARSDC